MRCRHFSPRTEESYLHAIEQLYLHYRRMPDRLSRDEVVGFLAHCVHERKLSRSTVNVYLQLCRFLYELVLEPDLNNGLNGLCKRAQLQSHNKKLATVDSRAGLFDDVRPLGRSSTAASVLTFC